MNRSYIILCYNINIPAGIMEAWPHHTANISKSAACQSQLIRPGQSRVITVAVGVLTITEASRLSD